MKLCPIAALALIGAVLMPAATGFAGLPVAHQDDARASVAPLDSPAFAALERETTEALDQWRKVLT